mmetsp:Transcript_52712/g.122925  ORF Transcript_52712/g.122925 Transcript_52712/m.122925 type:complete len:308 (-) Transcript_52712:2-925(-)
MDCMPANDHRQTMMFGWECRGLKERYFSKLFSPMYIRVSDCDRKIDHTWEFAASVQQKLAQVASYVNEWQQQQTGSQRMLVFTNSQQQADAVGEKLRTAILHRGVAEADQQREWAAFCKCETRVVVCTGYGVQEKDTSFVTEILNFDLPRDSKFLLVRHGKGLRRLGAAVKLTTFVGPEDLKSPEANQVLERMAEEFQSPVPDEIRDAEKAASRAGDRQWQEHDASNDRWPQPNQEGNSSDKWRADSWQAAQWGDYQQQCGATWTAQFRREDWRADDRGTANRQDWQRFWGREGSRPSWEDGSREWQ